MLCAVVLLIPGRVGVLIYIGFYSGTTGYDQLPFTLVEVISLLSAIIIGCAGLILFKTRDTIGLWALGFYIGLVLAAIVEHTALLSFAYIRNSI